MRAMAVREAAVPDGPMAGGTANRGLVRPGRASTVRRPRAPAGAATHALLGHLAAAGFDGAPPAAGRRRNHRDAELHRRLGRGAATAGGHAHRAGPDQRGATAAPLPPGGGLVRPGRIPLAAAEFRPASPQAAGQPQRRAPGQCDLPRRPDGGAHRLRPGRAGQPSLGPGRGRAALVPALRRAGRSATRARARRCAGSGCCWTPTGCPPPGGARSPGRSWPITTGAAPSSPTRRSPAIPASSTSGSRLAAPMTRARHWCETHQPTCGPRPGNCRPLNVIMTSVESGSTKVMITRGTLSWWRWRWRWPGIGAQRSRARGASAP